jgi:hypothetical protein
MDTKVLKWTQKYCEAKNTIWNKKFPVSPSWKWIRCLDKKEQKKFVFMCESKVIWFCPHCCSWGFCQKTHITHVGRFNKFYKAQLENTGQNWLLCTHRFNKYYAPQLAQTGQNWFSTRLKKIMLNSKVHCCPQIGDMFVHNLWTTNWLYFIEWAPNGSVFFWQPAFISRSDPTMIQIWV